MPIHSMPIDALDRACSYRGVIRRYSPTCLMAIAVLRLTARVKSNLLWEPKGLSARVSGSPHLLESYDPFHLVRPPQGAGFREKWYALATGCPLSRRLPRTGQVVRMRPVSCPLSYR